MNRYQRGVLIAIIIGWCVSGIMTVAWAGKVVVVPLTSSKRVADLEARVAQLEALLAGVIRTRNTITFSGVNIQVVNGSDSTDGAVNGLGNLIIGYNELRASDNIRTGSHNLIVGQKNNYSSYGGIVAGYNSNTGNIYASVTGGYGNTANGS